MTDSRYIVLFFAIPLLFSALTLMEKIYPRLKIAKISAVMSFAASAALLAFYTPGIFSGNVYTTVIGGWTDMVGITQQLDGTAWLGFVLMFTVSFFSMLYAFSDSGYESRFYFFFLVLHAGMAGMLLAADLFNLFVCLEITGICAYVLIAWTRKEKALFAGFKYLMLSSFGISLFLAGTFIIFRKTGSLQFSAMAQYFTSTPDRSVAAVFAMSALIAGIGVRTAFIPYTWLPDAHAFAPHPVSAVLSGVVIKVSFIAVWKLTMLLDLAGVRHFLLWMGCAIAVIGVLRALTQTDFKVLLAWHSVSQMGYIFAGFGAGTGYAVTGSMYHAISHALFKSLLFLSVSVPIIFTGERSLKRVAGLGKQLPLTALLFSIAALSIAGLPPFTGYVSKKLILDGLKDYPAAWWALVAASVGTVASFTKLSLLFRGRMPAGISAETVKVTKKPFIPGYAGMAFLALMCIAAGIGGTYMTETISLLLTDRPLKYSWVSLWGDPAEYLKALATVTAGILLYLFVMSSAGKKLQEYLKKIILSFDSQLVLLLCGFMVIAACIFYF